MGPWRGAAAACAPQPARVQGGRRGAVRAGACRGTRSAAPTPPPAAVPACWCGSASPSPVLALPARFDNWSIWPQLAHPLQPPRIPPRPLFHPNPLASHYLWHDPVAPPPRIHSLHHPPPASRRSVYTRLRPHGVSDARAPCDAQASRAPQSLVHRPWGVRRRAMRAQHETRLGPIPRSLMHAS